jgi:SAM-dependent methyltransferase
MKIKADWTTWLHRYKNREIALVFSKCRPYCFENGLELGAGDGYQGRLLSQYIRRLVSTEINKLHFSEKKNECVEYKISSAEEAVAGAQENFFDIVFSSNLLEHVVRPEEVLCGIHRILKNDGVTVHIIPSPFWKLCQIFFYLPANILVLIERITRNSGLLSALREIKAIVKEGIAGLLTGTNATLEQVAKEEARFGNNPGKTKKKSRFLKRAFFSEPHGISETHCEEFVAFSRKRWIRVFDESGFQCIVIRKGPAASGYGLGWAWADRIVEKAGLASEYIYIAQKKGCTSRFMPFFSE